MTKIVWDQVGERVYETGVDRGVLYLSDGRGVPWNGLTSVEESSGEVKQTSYHIDGVRYFNDRTDDDYSAVLKAYTYPEEFLEFDGYQAPTLGIFLDNQPVYNTFGLSYRTGLGNDINGVDFGYKLHVLYNLTATPSNREHTSLSDSVDPIEFSWDISAVPEFFYGFRPTAHLIIDTRFLVRSGVQAVEDILYGKSNTEPRLAPLSEIIGLVSTFNLTIIDNGDGTWTATGPVESITHVSETEFKIEWPTAVMVDDESYTLSNST